MKIIGLISVPILFLFLLGCEGETDGDGYVFSSKTKKPLDSVLVKSYAKTKRRKEFISQMITDSTGQFVGSTGLGGCMPCADLLVEFIKDGYKTKEIINPRKDTIYLDQ